ncbi:tripartite tricarboxylate transporter substrate binding protein [Roseomonas sp. KE2513]|uniref:Bug family tripartite tricarboxylate transporter substrate binding protein n=1 Tax=Roseomonas sp. KE2513 TaxID=2479202 RepID=UPI0018DFF440|nr:tripartite tricarboxylate transporter substrate binding protein [Roseomonas sp. KE2513]MBI0539659.1 tripartite tricarboxylate transporter substrate binding protein [Roseomonas sp. KE2513]
MTTGRRVLLGAGAALALRRPALAQVGGFPDRPIRIVVPHGPGGASDTWGRLIAEPLRALLGQPVLIENKPGASTMLAAETVARARPDGLTLLMGSVTTLSINPGIFRSMRYDPMRDFAPLSLVASAPMALAVSNGVPVRSVQELVAYAKERPGQLNYGSPGIGTSPHLTAALFASMTGTRFVHVPYRQSSEAELALIQQEVQLAFSGGFIPAIRADRVRGLAMTSPQRSALAPELPTVAEGGLPGFESAVWNGLLAPAGTPPEIVSLLSRRIVEAARRPETAQAYALIGAEVVASDPAEFAETIGRETVKWGRVIREAGIEAS